MPLMECPGCNKQVSTLAPNCIHCGRPRSPFDEKQEQGTTPNELHQSGEPELINPKNLISTTQNDVPIHHKLAACILFLVAWLLVVTFSFKTNVLYTGMFFYVSHDLLKGADWAVLKALIFVSGVSIYCLFMLFFQSPDFQSPLFFPAPNFLLVFTLLMNLALFGLLLGSPGKTRILMSAILIGLNFVLCALFFYFAYFVPVKNPIFPTIFNFLK